MLTFVFFIYAFILYPVYVTLLTSQLMLKSAVNIYSNMGISSKIYFCVSAEKIHKV